VPAQDVAFCDGKHFIDLPHLSTASHRVRVRLCCATMPERTEIVVLMLTDVESSTRLWQHHAEHMPAALAQLDQSVLESVAAHHGTLEPERGEGDSHFASFRLASDAVRAAVDLQRRLLETAQPGGIQLRVRIALHAGEVQHSGADYAGVAVNRAARLRSTAGQSHLI
ncbi:MAG TPA: adenylate/guanylate cyclase domain-containing protein, partial [Steroidobacteraceae bacterium]|nr:adenylate/guanylate cyclase domain-containing protein [Steroidobacteraceae bacterium]